MIQFEEAFAEARKDAIAAYPEESCGFIVGGRYLPMKNIAADPATHQSDNPDCGCRLCSFVISDRSYLDLAGQVQMVVHSHPNGPAHPSRSDMMSQMAMDIAWAIIVVNDEGLTGKPIVWGGDTPMQPILGREFVHGVSDCYTLIKDVYALGKDALAEQDIEWALPPIVLPEVPRDDAWWAGDYDLYEIDGFKAGFREIAQHEVRSGDGFLMKIRSEKFNHGGLVLSPDLILHHLPHRLSRREPSGIWARQVGKWLRYMGPDHA